MNKIKGLFILEYKKLMRTPIILGFGIFAPIFFLVVQTEISPKEILIGGSTIASIDYSFPMFSFLSIVVIAIGNVGVGISYNRLIHFFKRLKLAGVKPFEFITANFGVQFVVALFTILLLFGISIGKYKMEVQGKNILLYVLMLLVSFMMCYFIGITIANVTKDAKSSQSMSMLVYFVIVFLGGVTYPFEMMPNILQKVSNLIPSTHAVKLLQTVWSGGDIFEGNHLIIVLISTIIFAILSMRLFKYD